MALFAKPSGWLQTGRGLYKPPAVQHLKIGAPARILFVADLHLRPDHPEMADTVLDVCRDLAPELILLGGDLSEYDEGLTLFLEKLRKVFPDAPVYAVPGNNDDPLLDGDRARQKQLYEHFGAEYLLNEVRRTEINGSPIEIAGLEDAYTHTPDPTGLFSREGGVYRILMAHEPLSSCFCEEADLMLTGHTHGGQINVLGITCYFLIGYEKCFKYKLLAGSKKIGRTFVVVSRGIGYSKYPIRFGARSEVHCIE